jgi:hypothetical protein
MTTDEDRREAERLALCTPEVQEQVLAMHRADSLNKSIPKADREEAGRRFKSLKKLLKKSNNS